VKLRDRIRRLFRAEASDSSSYDARGVSRYLQSRHGAAGPLPNPAISPAGAGSATDQGSNAIFQAVFRNTPRELETLYDQSWAARKLVNIIPNDCWIRPREFDLDERAKAMLAAEHERLRLQPRICKAMKAARLHGDGYLVMVTAAEAGQMEVPLALDSVRLASGARGRPAVRETMLKAVHVADHFDLAPLAIVSDIASPRYGTPEFYQWSPQTGGGSTDSAGNALGTAGGQTIKVHASRVIHFPGREAPRADGWRAYPPAWGRSVLEDALREIMRDESAANAVSHMLNQASEMVLKKADLQQMRTGTSAEGVAHAETFAEMMFNMAANRSVYRMNVISDDDEMMRVNAPLAGLADLMDRNANRLAAIGDIPRTRFLGESPTGMQSTGSAELKTWAVKIRQVQEALRPILAPLDNVIARSLGMAEAPPYSWPSLVDESDGERAKVAETKAKVVLGLIQGDIIDQREARRILSGDPVIGDLPGDPPDSLEDLYDAAGVSPRLEA